MFDKLRDTGDANISYSVTVGDIKSLEVREEPVECITVQNRVSVLNLMKEKGMTPYVLPKNRSIHQKFPEERLTSEDEMQEDSEDGYHKGPQISSDESK